MSRRHPLVTLDDVLTRRAWAVRRMLEVLIEVHISQCRAAAVCGLQPATLIRARRRPEGSRNETVRALRIAYGRAVKMLPRDRLQDDAPPASLPVHRSSNVVCLERARMLHHWRKRHRVAPDEPVAPPPDDAA